MYICKYRNVSTLQTNEMFPRSVNNFGIEICVFTFFIKGAHRFKDSIACPETYMRVCFGG